MGSVPRERGSLLGAGREGSRDGRLAVACRPSTAAA